MTDYSKIDKLMEDITGDWKSRNKKLKDKRKEKRQRASISEGLTPPSPSSKNETSVLDFLGGSAKNAVQGFNPFDNVSMSQATDNQLNMLENPSNALEQTNRTSNRFLNSATLGGLELADTKLNDRNYEYLQNKEGFDSSDIGNILGYLAPGGLAANAVRGTKLGANVTSNMSKLGKFGQRAKEGAIIGAGMGAAETSIDELIDPNQKNLPQHLGQIGLEASIGAVADPLIGMGLDKLLKPKNLTMGDKDPLDFLSKTGEFANTSTTGRQLDPNEVFQSQSSDPLGLNEPLRFRSSKQEPPTSSVLGLGDGSIPKMDSTPYGDIPLTETKGNGLPRSYWEGRLNDFSKAVEGVQLPPGREQETLEEMWNQFAKPNEPNLNDVVELATPSLDEYNQYNVGKEGEPLKFKQTKVGRPPQQEDPFETLNFTGKSDRPFSSTRVDGNYKTTPTNDGVKVTSSRKPIDDVLEDFNVENPTYNTKQGQDKSAPLGFQNTQNVEGNLNRGIDTYGLRSRSKENKETALGKMWNTFQREASDERVYAKKIENELEGKGRFKNKGPLFQKLTNMSGSSGAAEHKLNTELLPVLENLRSKGKSVGRAFEYRIAKHLKSVLDDVKLNNDMVANKEFVIHDLQNKLKQAKQYGDESLQKSLKNKIKKEQARTKRNYQLPDGMTDIDINNILSKYGNDPDLQEFDRQITKYFDSLLDLAVEKGQLSTDARQALKTKYPDYFPLFRVKDLESTESFEKAFNNFGFTSGGRKDPIHKLQEGSTEPIADPIESLVKYTENMMYSTFRNDALRELDRLAKLDTEGKWIRKDRKGKNDNEITFKVDGKEVKYYVSQDFREALDIANDAGLSTNFLVKGAYSLAKAQRLAITGNPSFVVFRSLLRDIPQSWKSSRAGFNVFDLYNATLDLFTGGKALGDKSMLDEFYMNGAGMNTIWANDSKEFRKFRNMAYGDEKPTMIVTLDPNNKAFAKKFGDLIEWYRGQVDNFEQIPKMAEYRASKRKGKSGTESAFNARTILDYNKAGRSTKTLNRFSAFVNTTIRGRDKYVDSLVERPLQTLTKTASFSGSLSALAYWAKNELANEEQRRFIDEAPDWMRDTYWLFPSPNSGEVVKMPKPFESAALVSTPLETYFRFAEGKNVNIKSEVRDWVVDNIFIDPSLTPVTPFIEASLNKDSFTNRPIVDEDKKPIDQKDVYTSGISNSVAKGLQNVGLDNLASPKKIDHIIEGLFPVTGENMTQSMDQRLAEFGLAEKPNYPEGTHEDPAKTFFTGGAVREKVEGRTSPLIGKFYEVDDKIRAIREKNPKAFTNKKLYDQINKAINHANKISSKINRIEESKKLNPKQKRQQLDSLIEERNRIIRYFDDKGVYDRIDKIYQGL